jgi:hypothetical protein
MQNASQAAMVKAKMLDEGWKCHQHSEKAKHECEFNNPGSKARAIAIDLKESVAICQAAAIAIKQERGYPRLVRTETKWEIVFKPTWPGWDPITVYSEFRGGCWRRPQIKWGDCCGEFHSESRQYGEQIVKAAEMAKAIEDGKSPEEVLC